MNKDKLKSLFYGIDSQYINLIKNVKKPLITALNELNLIIKTDGEETIVPKIENIFACFRNLPMIKMVLVGQDPFIKKNQAMGYSFSVPKSMSIPPSTKNIYSALVQSKLLESTPIHGDLSILASQGILFLNAALTTKLGVSDAHKFWKDFTDKLLIDIDNNYDEIVFVLLGGFAIEKEKLLKNENNLILKWGHPSPLNRANLTDNPLHFKYTDVFTKTNEYLISVKKDPIDYSSLLNDVEQKFIDNELTNDTSLSSVDSLSTNDNFKFKFNSTSYDPLSIYKPVISESFDLVIYLFTDGSAKNNTKPPICTAGWGYYYISINNKTELVASKTGCGVVERKHENNEVIHPSNQRGELMGIMNGLLNVAHLINSFVNNMEVKDAVEKLSSLKIILNIISDSEYSINVITKWYYSWVAKKQLEGKKNLDIIHQIMDLNKMLEKYKIKIKYQHIRSHKAEPRQGTYEWFLWYGNDVVDKLAGSVV